MNAQPQSPATQRPFDLYDAYRAIRPAARTLPALATAAEQDPDDTWGRMDDIMEAAGREWKRLDAAHDALEDGTGPGAEDVLAEVKSLALILKALAAGWIRAEGDGSMERTEDEPAEAYFDALMFVANRLRVQFSEKARIGAIEATDPPAE
jgi:hypothetical protein